MNQYSVGRFIAKLRKEKNLTQRDLAEKLGITNQAVSKWERGENLPDISILMELAKIFNVTVDELLKGERVLVEAENPVVKEELVKSEPIKEETYVNESNDKQQPNKKLWMAVAIGMFVVSPACFFLFDNNILNFVSFFALMGTATFLMIYNAPTERRRHDINPKIQPLVSIIYSSAVIIFFAIGYIFKTYSTAWLVFLFSTLLVKIIKYKYNNEN